MADRIKTALVLCTGNSARSIMGEALITHLGGGRWQGVSAGSHPTGRINAFALQALAAAGIPPPAAPRSKSWDEFARPGAAPIDLVVTVCDNAANGGCPGFPGSARIVHKSFPDPAAVGGTDAEKLQAFQNVLEHMRIEFASLLQD